MLDLNSSPLLWEAQLAERHREIAALPASARMRGLRPSGVRTVPAHLLAHLALHLDRRELLDWLATPAQHEQVREPILIKVFFGSSLPKPELISVLQNCADETRTALTYLQYAHQFVDKFVESIGLQHEALFWQLTIDCGLKVHKAELDWTEEAIQKIKAADDSIFENEQHGYDGVNEVRTAMEALDRIKAAMPGALAGADTYLHAGSQGEKAITEEAVI